MRKRKTVYPGAPLTPKDIEIIKLIALSDTRLRIAVKLGLAEKTIDYHLRNISTKIGIVGGDYAAFTRFAVRHGLINPYV